ncbi:MAG: hypothetical protein IJR97_07380, partial [Clostridia bacterium]|nr:hypothetical protein [Clostridia bacterium]
MTMAAAARPGNARRTWNRVWTYISKPHNAILLVLGIVLTITTIYPMVMILRDTVRIHPGSIDVPAQTEQAAEGAEQAETPEYTTYNWT